MIRKGTVNVGDIVNTEAELAVTGDITQARRTTLPQGNDSECYVDFMYDNIGSTPTILFTYEDSEGVPSDANKVLPILLIGATNNSARIHLEELKAMQQHAIIHVVML